MKTSWLTEYIAGNSGIVLARAINSVQANFEQMPNVISVKPTTTGYTITGDRHHERTHHAIVTFEVVEDDHDAHEDTKSPWPGQEKLNVFGRSRP
jgi:hypothetical protein